MKKLFTKLNNRRGASILMALLLFLICALAGAAALTAAGSNIGRFGYIQQDQQQYLAVSSAAKLLRSQLDGFTAKGEFKVKGPDILDETNLYLDPTKPYSLAIKDGGSSLQPPEPFTYKLGTGGDSGGVINLLKDDIDKYVKNALYTYVEEKLQDSQVWAHIKNEDMEEYQNVLNGYPAEMSFDVTCDQITDKDDNPVKVTAVLKFDDPEKGLTEGSLKAVTLTVSCGETIYELTGWMNVKNVKTDEHEVMVQREYETEDLDEEGNPIKYPVELPMILESTAKVTVKIDLDNEISRVSSPAPGIGGDET